MSVLANLKGANSLADLAKILGYKPSALSYILYKIPEPAKYQKFTVPKSGGGEREICAPVERLKTLQRRLANALYACRDDIDRKSGRRPLSHAFRRTEIVTNGRRHKLSIVTNARRHKRQRYVLNLDLQDFFPAFNFGRVRGFFIHNNDFKLDEKVATIIAQIACFENALPQGSPCSPVIADLIAHLLDVRLAQLAKKHQLTYSRYADDLTFSTSRRDFPPSIAAPVAPESPQWVPGPELVKVIEKSGFVINPAKTRMQFRMSRQLVTGLTVNAKVNIRPEYYRRARAMCHTLFETGQYYRPSGVPDNEAEDGEDAKLESVESLNPLEGILSHIHHVKDAVDERAEPDKRKYPTAARKLYARFLKYRYFVRLDRPLIVCEGKTDNIYLKHAIRQLTDFHPKLGAWESSSFKSAVRFFDYTDRARELLQLSGGAGNLKNYFFIKNCYAKDIRGFKHRLLAHPVIILIDNDDGASDIFRALKENFNISIDFESVDAFFHITDNLYLVKTPSKDKKMKSCIEDFFDSNLLETKLDGKKLNLKKGHGADGEYGKYVFAKNVIRPNADKIDFSGFKPLLERVVAAIDHYKPTKEQDGEISEQ